MLDAVVLRLKLTVDTALAEPALWLCATLLACAFGMWLYKKSSYKTICTPFLISTVALAVPLYEQRLRLAKLWIPLTCGLVAGAQLRSSPRFRLRALRELQPKQ